MTCSHVLGLIDAGPDADYPPAHLEAAWRHARECPTCGPALEISTVMSRELAGLLRMDPPAHLAAAVAARIARLDAPPRALRDPRPVPRTAAVAGWWPDVSVVVGGVMAGVAAMASLPPGEWTVQRFGTIWAGWTGAEAIAAPASAGGMLALTGGVLLFVIGLLSVRDSTRHLPGPLSAHRRNVGKHLTRRE